MGGLEDLRLKYGPEHFVMGKELMDTGWRWPEVSVDECRDHHSYWKPLAGWGVSRGPQVALGVHGAYHGSVA